MYFCISARLYLIMSRHCSVQFIRSSCLFGRTPKELFLFLLFSVAGYSVHPYSPVDYFCYLNVCNTEIMMCGWKDFLCCSFWTSSSMNADLNVFNTCFTSRVSVELEQRMFCRRPYQWMTAFPSEAWWWPILWFIDIGSYKTCFHWHSRFETVLIDITESFSFRNKIAWVFESSNFLTINGAALM